MGKRKTNMLREFSVVLFSQIWVRFCPVKIFVPHIYVRPDAMYIRYPTLRIVRRSANENLTQLDQNGLPRIFLKLLLDPYS